MECTTILATHVPSRALLLPLLESSSPHGVGQLHRHCHRHQHRHSRSYRHHFGIHHGNVISSTAVSSMSVHSFLILHLALQAARAAQVASAFVSARLLGAEHCLSLALHMAGLQCARSAPHLVCCLHVTDMGSLSSCVCVRCIHAVFGSV